ncbi:MAG: abortive infection family protein [Lachnospiraceae bacterium]|nr:abortive infection family protein [Lachnospiraceae bacterium]
MVASLLSGLLDYFHSEMGSGPWCDEDINDYRQVEGIVERLSAMNTVSLPQQESGDLKLILNEIESNIREGNPELAIDRLHTFSAQFFRKICQKHKLPIVNDRGDRLPLDGLVGKLRRFYEQNNYFESEFCVIAIKNAISLFTQYNYLRNNRSAAHPNPLLQKVEAEYAVKVVADTLMFVDEIEKSKDEENSLPYNSFSQIDEEFLF